ncbi:MAG: DNA polymerase III subunit gamma/tau [Clostridiales bacterium]|nr:DNA polymerase III subunit gamma/tau [Clostridiales bacterium]
MSVSILSEEYKALYRKHRPDSFDGIVGQDMVIRTLKNQIKNGQIAHAYLFCGPRGTGKTSTAKVFSKAINCENIKEDGPCGVCDVCESMASGSNMDIIEIDAASNNSVDDVRDLREKVKFPPTKGSYKVYIIDEVHMLSQGAFNALLKTLEEPPKHVVFILATTEPHKLPATILSRCQRFDFKRIGQGTIVEWIRSIAQKEGLDIEESALYSIARQAEGGARDALSLLDQSMGLYGKKISNEGILSILGTASQDFLFTTVDDLIAGRVQGLLEAINKLVDNGKDLSVFVKGLNGHLRDMLVAKLCDKPSDLIDRESSELDRLINQAQGASETRLVRAVEILSELLAYIKKSSQPRILLELALIKICRLSQEDSYDALIDRIELLEKQVKDNSQRLPRQMTEAVAVYEKEPSPNASIDIVERVPAKEDYESDPGPESSLEPDSIPMPKDEGAKAKVKDPIANWPQILELVRKDRIAIYGLLADAKPRLKENRLILYFPPMQGFYAAAIDKEDNKAYLEGLIKQLTGTDLRLKCLIEDEDMIEAETVEDEDYIVKKAIEIFGADSVEVLEEK